MAERNGSCERVSSITYNGSSMRVALIACAKHPELSASNELYRRALERRGAAVEIIRWNRTPASRMGGFDLGVFRQSWDYQDDPAGFAAWVADAHRRGARLANPADVVIWNNDKRTIAELHEIGVEMPWTADLGLTNDPDTEGMPEHLVLKPAFGGSGVGVRRCERRTVRTTLNEAREEAPGRPFFAQAFVPEIAAGEWSVTCAAGMVTHCVRKRPPEGEFRVNGRFAPSVELVEAPAAMRDAARRVADHFGPDVLYMRLDGIMINDAFTCTELELTDPDLHFEWFEEGADILARATIEQAQFQTAH